MASTRTKRLRAGRKKKTQASKVLGWLEEGRIDPREAMSDERYSKYVDHVRLWTILMRCPRMGEAGVKKCLFAANVYPMYRLRDLSASEVERVIQCLPARVWRDRA